MTNTWHSYIETNGTLSIHSQDNTDGILDAIFRRVGVTESPCLVDLGACPIGDESRYVCNWKAWDEIGWKTYLFDGRDGARDDFRFPQINVGWLTAENVIQALRQAEVPQVIDFLSIDLDGNDFYILDTILTNGYKPNVIVAEYNPKFDGNQSVSIKYNPKHTWQEDDYYGFSLAAGRKLMARHGYEVVYANGLNMFAVKRELVDAVWEIHSMTLIPQNLHAQQVHPPTKRMDAIWIEVE